MAAEALPGAGGPAVTLREPLWLVLWLPVVALGAAHVVLADRRRRNAVRFTEVELAAVVLPPSAGWRRPLVAGLMLAGLAALVGGLARPAASFPVRRSQATLVLAIDVSPSMMAADVPPTRFGAAVEAVRSLVEDLPPGFLVGVVSFAGTAEVVLPPTGDHNLVARTVERLRFRSETAIGDAVAAAVSAAEASDVEPRLVVLLSDGAQTRGLPVDEAVSLARRAGVPVSTVAFGTAGGVVTLDGRDVPVPPDPATLERIASATGGRTATASTADELVEAFRSLTGTLRTRRELRDVSWIPLAAGTLLVGIAAALSAHWFGRFP